MNWASRLSCAVLGVMIVASPVRADPAFTVVADGLQSPRGLAFGPGGRLYVAQAGAGGDSGRITEIRLPWSPAPLVRDLLTGLPSRDDGMGGFLGVAGLSAAGNGTLYAVVGIVYPPVAPVEGHLLKINAAGQVLDVADVAAIDFAWFDDHPELANPDDHPDANPYGVLVRGSEIYVVDAATNTLTAVRKNGRMEVVAYFPDNALRDATPTCIAQGPDGALYIGTLALEDSLASGPSAIVYRVDPAATNPDDLATVLDVATPWATGLNPINGCAFGPDGSLYVTELVTGPGFSGGDVVRIPFATPDVHVSLTGATLAFPGGVAIGPDGGVYVANGSAFVPGQIVRLTASAGEGKGWRGPQDDTPFDIPGPRPMPRFGGAAP